MVSDIVNGSIDLFLKFWLPVILICSLFLWPKSYCTNQGQCFCDKYCISICEVSWLLETSKVSLASESQYHKNYPANFGTCIFYLEKKFMSYSPGLEDFIVGQVV